MPVYRIPRRVLFPPASAAEPDGLLGVGGDLRPERLVLAYASGIFPWYSEGRSILWFSPDPRFVLPIDGLHISRSLRKRVRRGDYEITLDTAFSEVISACKTKSRPGQRGTWITTDMRKAYIELHERGIAHSAEAWKDGQLVGGLYGVALGGLFAGESMFAHAADASKCAFVWLVRQLEVWGFGLIDSQIHTHHLERFGAVHIPREDYLARLPELLDMPGRLGPWSFDPDFDPLDEPAGAPSGDP